MHRAFEFNDRSVLREMVMLLDALNDGAEKE